jgi:ubiquinone/menaquinone biosynthesis C-methylase UbiE
MTSKPTAASGYHDLELQIALDPSDPRNALPVVDANRKALLDIGCGAGQTLVAVNRSGAHTYGLDMDMDALRAGKHRHPQVGFVCASGEALPFRDRSFDFVICRVALPYMHIPRALAEINRVLEPNGEVWLLLHSFRFFMRRVQKSFAGLDWKDLIFSVYVAMNSTALFLGFQFRFPAKWRCESFQTRSSIRSALERSGFTDVRIDQGKFFIVTARRKQ